MPSMLLTNPILHLVVNLASPSRLDPLRQGAYGGQLGSPSHIDPLRQGAYNDDRLRKKELIKEQELRREKFTRGIQQDLRPKPAS